MTLRAAFLAAGLLALAAHPTTAQRPVPVDLELSFVVDASGSIDSEEMRLQRQGYADALATPQVIKAVTSGFLRSIAITYIEFAADGCIWQWVDWVQITDLAAARSAGAKIMAAPRELCSGGNAIGEAVAFATKSTLQNGFDGTRKVIDVSGDGPDTTGAIAVEDARDAAIAQGFTINGLVVERPSMPSLPDYYRAAIIGGPRSFVIRAEGRKTFAEAILKKLILEIADTGGYQQAEWK
ncbi:MAG: DUF1194 domain-containing protein [Alphaproteobacteria bacterium]